MRKIEAHFSYFAVLFLVGNKTDISSNRQINQSQAETYSHSIDAHFREISASASQGGIVSLAN